MAQCCEAAYTTLSLASAAQLMFFPSVDAFLELARTVRASPARQVHGALAALLTPALRRALSSLAETVDGGRGQRHGDLPDAAAGAVAHRHSVTSPDQPDAALRARARAHRLEALASQKARMLES